MDGVSPPSGPRAIRLAEMFRRWQACRWNSEIKARLIDHAVGDWLNRPHGVPHALFEEYGAIRMSEAICYGEMVEMLREEAAR